MANHGKLVQTFFINFSFPDDDSDQFLENSYIFSKWPGYGCFSEIGHCEDQGSQDKNGRSGTKTDAGWKTFCKSVGLNFSKRTADG